MVNETNVSHHFHAAEDASTATSKFFPSSGLLHSNLVKNRRFGTTYRPVIHGPSVQEESRETLDP